MMKVYQIKSIGDKATRFFNGDYPIDEREVELVSLDADMYESFYCDLEDVYAAGDYYVGQLIIADIRYSTCKKCGHCHEKAYAYSIELIDEIEKFRKEGKLK